MYSIFEQLLRERGVTVADVCRATGIKQSTMSNWKKRRNRLSPDNALLVANYFGVSVDYLYGSISKDIEHEIKAQSLFESQLRFYGWKIECDDPSKEKPCVDCISKNMVDGVPWWALPDGKEPEKLCDVCVLHDSKHILTKGDLRLVFSDDEYMDLINRTQNETIESVIRFHEEDSDEQNYRIPVLRRVAAGRPLDAVDEILDWIEIPERLISNGTYFGLQIRGDSMEPNIKDGDYVICREQPDAETGEVAVVLINDSEGVCKRIKKYENGKIALMSDNPTYEPMYFDTHSSSERVVIRGIVKWSIRSY